MLHGSIRGDGEALRESQCALVANFLQAHRDILQSSLHQWKKKIANQKEKEKGQVFCSLLENSWLLINLVSRRTSS